VCYIISVLLWCHDWVCYLCHDWVCYTYVCYFDPMISCNNNSNNNNNNNNSNNNNNRRMQIWQINIQHVLSYMFPHQNKSGGVLVCLSNVPEMSLYWIFIHQLVDVFESVLSSLCFSFLNIHEVTIKPSSYDNSLLIHHVCSSCAWYDISINTSVCIDQRSGVVVEKGRSLWGHAGLPDPVSACVARRSARWESSASGGGAAGSGSPSPCSAWPPRHPGNLGGGVAFSTLGAWHYVYWGRGI